MKFLGHFLVKKGLITEATLLASLVEQIEGMPSLCSVVYEQRLMSEQQQLAAIAYQVEHEVDYRSAAVALGYWTDHAQNHMLAAFSRHSKPLGQILLQKQMISIADLNEALSEFVSIAPDSRHSMVEAAHQRIVQARKPENLSSVRPWLNDYCLLFDDEMRDRLKNGRVTNHIIDSLAFAASFSGAPQSAELFRKLKTVIYSNQELASDCIEKLWKIRTNLESRQSEQNAMGDLA